MLIFLSTTGPFRSQTIHKEVTSKILKGGEWLLRYEGEFRDPGILWILSKINKKYCNKESVTQFIKSTFQREFAHDPIQKGYGRLLEIPIEYEIDNARLQARETQYDNLLLPVIYCDQKTIATATQKEIFNTSVYGYDLTHRLLALLFLKQNNCIDSDTADGVIYQMVNQIYNDLDTVGVDLYAEKIAFIEFAGYTNLINEKEIQEILGMQQSGGAWQDPLYLEGVDNPHTTALSLWALAQYYNICPF